MRVDELSGKVYSAWRSEGGKAGGSEARETWSRLAGRTAAAAAVSGRRCSRGRAAKKEEQRNEAEGGCEPDVRNRALARRRLRGGDKREASAALLAVRKVVHHGVAFSPGEGAVGKGGERLKIGMEFG